MAQPRLGGQLIRTVITPLAASTRRGRRPAGRRLAAVMSVDIKGYSLMMVRDEEVTHDRVGTALGRLVRHIEKSRGRVFSFSGDGVMAEFPSSVEALRCALRVQAEAERQNARVEAERRIEYRIGINAGDIVDQDGRMGGDAVNIAARLEQIGQAGSITISTAVFDQVSHAVAAKYECLGPVSMKNIRQAVTIWRVTGRSATARTEFVRQPAPVTDDLPTRPATLAVADSNDASAMLRRSRNAIVVMPFANLSGDRSEEYFADGMVEDITTELSHFKSLFVIARNSAFTLKGRGLDAREVGRELGVDYVVEGSVRRSSNLIRVTARLISSATGAHLWAERFEGDADEVFDLQDRISQRVVSAIEPKVLATEIERARRKPADSLDAYDFYLRSAPYREGVTAESIANALALLRASLALDPHYAPALAAAASCHLGRRDQGWSTPLEDDVREGLRFAYAAIAAGKDDAQALCLGGHTIASLADDYRAGAALLDRALELNNNYADAWMRSAMVRIYLDDLPKAIAHSERAIMLSPVDPRLYIPLSAQGYAYLMLEQFELGVEVAQRALRTPQRPEMAHRILISALSGLGRMKDAETAAANLMRQLPSFRISHWRTRSKFTADKRFDFMEYSLRCAGLPS